MEWMSEMSTAGLFALREVLAGGDPAMVRRCVDVVNRELRKRNGDGGAEGRAGFLADWLAVAERVHGACGGPATKAVKRKAAKRKARRVLVSC